MAVALDTLRRVWISLISSRAAGAADLSPRVCVVTTLPPAGLNHIEAQALGTLDGEAVYFTRSMRWFSGISRQTNDCLLDADVTGSIRRSSGLAHLEECALPGSPVPP